MQNRDLERLLQLDHVNGIVRQKMASDLDFGILVFIGLISVVLSYYCIKDK
jgi:hypothetical protein